MNFLISLESAYFQNDSSFKFISKRKYRKKLFVSAFLLKFSSITYVRKFKMKCAAASHRKSAIRYSMVPSSSKSIAQKKVKKTKVPKLNFDVIADEIKDENKPEQNTSRISKAKTRKAQPQTSRSTAKTTVLKQATAPTQVLPMQIQEPITPDVAKQNYSNLLNQFEMKEIDEYKEIYFLGSKAVKVHPTTSPIYNFGYDDKNNHYRTKIGDHIAYRYEIRSVLGKGAFGQVLRCYDHKTKDYVALKMIVNTPTMQEQGKVEVSVLKILSTSDSTDKSILMKGFDYFTFRNHICITTEILGDDLYEVSRKMHFRPFSLAQVKSISKDILQSLKIIHENRIIHCDMKPENVLLIPGSTKNVKIIDFGSSCKIGEQKYEYIQSRFYRAPEVILGLKYGTAMDIWSFACIVCEMLLGKPIFSGVDEADQMNMYMEVFGKPPVDLIDKCDRRKYYFDKHYNVISVSKNKKRRRIHSTTLSTISKIKNPLLLDLLSKCFEWDQDKRITAADALNHPFFTTKLEKPTKPSYASQKPLSARRYESSRWR